MTGTAIPPEDPGTAIPPGDAGPGRGAQRLARLADAAAGLRTRRTRGTGDDRWLLLVGGTAMPLGVLLILLGWYGSAQTVLSFEQTPYLISGGLLGLALVVGGGLLYFAYWLTLQVREDRVERARMTAHQDRLEALLVELVGRLGPVRSAPAPDRVVTTLSGTLVHRPDCRATAGLEVVELEVDDPALELCGLCQPTAPPPRTRAAVTRAPATRAPSSRATPVHPAPAHPKRAARPARAPR